MHVCGKFVITDMLLTDHKTRAEEQMTVILTTSESALTEHHAMKVYWANGGIAPHILDLGTSWR
jgi:hypothetical protein